MAADLFARYIWLVDTILRGGERGLALEEINRCWMLSQYNETGEKYPERSSYRHKNARCSTSNATGARSLPGRRRGLQSYISHDCLHC